MNDRETEAYVEEINQYGSTFGLSNIHNLLQFLDNPQDALLFIHIAGTNGKGSTLAFISTILKCAGLKVGRYISPTLFDYRERIQINGRMISKKDLASYMTRIKESITDMQKAGFPHPTAFEIETALSFLYFKEKGCELVVLETGLGGLLDATNIIKTTLVAVLTSISMDHMAFLGNSLEQIAIQKAGIIKDKCYVVCNEQEKEVMAVIEGICEKKGNILRIAKKSDLTNVRYGLKVQMFNYKEWKKIKIALAGTYQIENAIVSLEVINALRALDFTITKNAIYKGFMETIWPGRFTIIADSPLFIIDGAHNENAAKQLADSIRFYFTNKRIIYIIGVLKDKQYDKIIQETYAYAEQIITISTPNHKRGMPAYELAQEIQPYHDSVTVADSLQEAVEISYLLADKDSVIIAFGSLSYLGELATIVQSRDKIRRDSHGRSK